MIISDEGHCLNILENMKYSVSEITKKMTIEKQNFLSIYNQLNKNPIQKSNGKNQSTNILEENPAQNEELEKLKSSLQKGFYSLEITTLNFLESVEYKIKIFNEEYKNDFLFIREEYGVISKIINEAGKLVKKIEDLKKFRFNFNEEKIMKENVSKSKSKSVRNQIQSEKKGSENFKNESQIKRISIGSFKNNNSNSQSQVMPSNSQQEFSTQKSKISFDKESSVNLLLSDNKNFVDLTDDQYNLFLVELSSLSNHNKKFINKNFLNNLRKSFLGQYNINYSLDKLEWNKYINQIDLTLTEENYFITIMTITSNDSPFPGLKFCSKEIRNLFIDYFSKIEGNELKIIGMTVEKKKFLKIISSEDFVNSYKVKKIRIQLFQWFEDAVVNDLQNISVFSSNMIKKEIEILKKKVDEIILLRKKLANLVWDQKNNNMIQSQSISQSQNYSQRLMK
jgi:hypothetical protein